MCGNRFVEPVGNLCSDIDNRLFFCNFGLLDINAARGVIKGRYADVIFDDQPDGPIKPP